ncbi:MAG: metal ABC transporter permease, partial [bacterium]|nr:metal ABC transporter permease [bacterium]
ILIAKNPVAEARGLNIFAGNLLYMNVNELIIISLAAFFIFLLHLIFHKEFMFISFDKETALTTGLKANQIDFLLYLSIGILISLTMKTSGIIFVFGSLIIPPMTALIFARKASTVLWVSPVLAIISVISGFLIAYLNDLPVSPAIIGVYGVLFLFLMIIKLTLRK